MTLKDGLAAMRNSRKEERGEETPAPAPEATPLQKTTEKREPFATRLKPSLLHDLKRRVQELSEQGKRVTVEDVLNALLACYLEDETLRQAVEEKLS